MTLYYKFLPIERLSYLEDGLLRFTQPADLNDPYECLPQKPSYDAAVNVVKTASLLVLDIQKSNTNNEGFVEKIKENLKGLRERNEGNLLDKLYNESYVKINEEIGILSLSRNWNNVLMWAHYTILHKGFCVGFDSGDEYFKDYISADRTKSKTIKGVVYSKKRVKIPMSVSEKKLEFEPFITKSTDWKYEEEVRVISTLNLSDEKKEKEPYDIHLYNVPHQAIREIILGINIDGKSENIIREFCQEHEIDMYKATISENEFDVERTT